MKQNETNLKNEEGIKTVEEYLYLYFFFSLKKAYAYPSFAKFIVRNNKDFDKVVEEIWSYYYQNIHGASPDAFMNAIDNCLADTTDYDDGEEANYMVDWKIDDLLEITVCDGYLDEAISSM